MARFTKVATPLLLIMSVAPTLADEGASGSMSQVTSALVLASRLTPACISAQELATTTAISKFTSRVGKFCLMSISDRSPRHSQPYGFPNTKFLGGRIGLSLGSSYSFAWAHGVVTGLINAEETVEGWGLGDTIPRAQIGWTSSLWSNTFYLTGWLPTGRYQRGFEPNTGKNRYGVNLGWETNLHRAQH